MTDSGAKARLRSDYALLRGTIVPRLARPWHEAADEHAVHFEEELARELHPEHRLWGETWLLIARRQDQDDFAFLLPGGRIATVHLTFTGEAERDNWPATAVSPSADAWIRDIVQPDIDYWSQA